MAISRSAWAIIGGDHGAGNQAMPVAGQPAESSRQGSRYLLLCGAVIFAEAHATPTSIMEGSASCRFLLVLEGNSRKFKLERCANINQPSCRCMIISVYESPPKRVVMSVINRILFVAQAAVILISPSVLAAPDVPLFDRLGGMNNIAAIVSETIDRTSHDARTKRNFQGINLRSVKESVAQHLCNLSGGPCKYEGATMSRAHSDMAITSEEFDIMDGYLGQALTSHGVADVDKSELQKLLGAMKLDIIGK